jgi:hypothetical protein
MRRRNDAQPHALSSVEMETAPDEFDSVEGDGGMDSPRPDPYASSFSMPPPGGDEATRDKQYTL